MFKKLRNHFLIMHMGIVSLLVVVFFGSVLIMIYNSMENESDRRLNDFMRRRSRTTEASLEFHDDRQTEFWSVTATVTDEKSAVSVFTSPQDFPDGVRLRIDRMTPGIYIATDDNHQVTEVFDVFEMGDEFYQQATSVVMATPERQNGKIRLDGIDFKYQLSGNEIALINITHESAMFYDMLRLFLLIALPLLFVIFLISMFFARTAIKPIETSYNRQKEFIADASHELKTPLASINANLDVLDGTATNEQRQWVGYIKTEVGRMSDLTSSLLYLTKMDFVQKNENGEEINIGQLVEDHLLPLEAALFEKGVSLSVEIKPDSLFIRGNTEQIKRMIGILADNAFRYAESFIKVKAERVQNNVLLTFANDGPGIPPDEINRIWERFYRSDKARMYDGGYGLGLPMGKAIVLRHGGKISCESVPGKKTEFFVKLPLSQTR